jgi:hypothetical protein
MVHQLLHGNPCWLSQNKQDLGPVVENVVFVVKFYVRTGYRNVKHGNVCAKNSLNIDVRPHTPCSLAWLETDKLLPWSRKPIVIAPDRLWYRRVCVVTC